MTAVSSRWERSPSVADRRQDPQAVVECGAADLDLPLREQPDLHRKVGAAFGLQPVSAFGQCDEGSRGHTEDVGVARRDVCDGYRGAG